MNGYVVDLDDPEVGRITVAGSPLTITPPARVRSAAPVLGAHTDDVPAREGASRRRRA